MKIFLDTNIFPEFIDRRVTTGSGHFVTVTKYPDPDVTLASDGSYIGFIFFRSACFCGNDRCKHSVLPLCQPTI